jgi:membrane associated rhomboid family serine protease
MPYSATAVDEFDRPRMTPAVQWLIALNVAIFFFQSTVVDPGDMQQALGFQASDVPTYWWKAFTYMFVHGGLWHILGNMYMLWLFGTRVEHRWTPAAFARYYVFCGLGAALVQVLVQVLSGQDGLLIGASGAVYGVMLAYAVNWPHDELLLLGVIPIKVKWLVAGYVAYDFCLGVLQHMGGSGDSTAHAAHLGGLAAGFLLLRAPSPRRLDRVRHRVSPVPDVSDEPTPPRAVPRSLPRQPREPEVDDVVAKSKAAVARRPVTPPPPPTLRPPVALKAARNGDDLNLLLDKISEHGMESLTADERQTLEAASRRLRETR